MSTLPAEIGQLRNLKRLFKDEGWAISHVEGAALREFHALLNEIDKKKTWGGLRRVVAKATGDVLWVCRKHYKIYDPGLPKQPKQK